LERDLDLEAEALGGGDGERLRELMAALGINYKMKV